ncbi:hypothetical protein HO133_004301 [Letharia lupina]|uniref:Uncharacterized protein n=2 Tax=Letharia TaxID=112415 RepID=A0A8H6L2V9_9LECA|nr:uncharacterized protein HO133_004301 [Letharia lupina]XP_037158496.1 uncharacterized protein HO173_012751 [Letharia columbiana]XP_037162908.1 uncharacterized protein HO173_008422 [Letharia columbiana]KAF6225367.1 hypothetical protein HO173_012751 [Letharia columbiana]KAF6229963.1 hypothetical protein HO133_004301 [Letharia lupina]KAF6233490.1 hypothetical protein HO173_008422 [Letharia columbiana]
MPDYKAKGELMRSTAYSFCKAFTTGSPPSETLDKYFTSNPKILEHGPKWANLRLPFLGIKFHGRRSQGSSTATSRRTCDDYYDRLTSTLSFHPYENTVPPKEEFMVDAEGGTVTIKLRAKFASVKTGKDWEEDFVYVLSEFDEEGKIGSQELWADPLSAWVAVGDD